MSDVLDRDIDDEVELHLGEPVRWTNQKVQEMLALFNIGKTFSEIADAMGISRNAAIAKAWRMKLTRNGKQIKPRMIEETEKDQRIRDRHVEKAPITLAGKPSTEIIRDYSRATGFKQPKIEVKPNSIAAKVLAIKVTTCPWPIGHPVENDFRFCGQEKSVDRHYCSEHSAIAYKPKV